MPQHQRASTAAPGPSQRAPSGPSALVVAAEEARRKWAWDLEQLANMLEGRVRFADASLDPSLVGLDVGSQKGALGDGEPGADPREKDQLTSAARAVGLVDYRLDQRERSFVLHSCPRRITECLVMDGLVAVVRRGDGESSQRFHSRVVVLPALQANLLQVLLQVAENSVISRGYSMEAAGIEPKSGHLG